MNVAVLGGGLSGLACLSELRRKGIDAFLLEAQSAAGGLAKTALINGYTYDLHGGHVFNSKHKEVRDWVFSRLPEEAWESSPRVAKIHHADRLISYPFEYALWELPADIAADCIVDLAASRKGPEPAVFGDWLVWAFGRRIAQEYLLPYNRKIWRYDLSKMSSHWVQGKMPIPTLREVLLAVLRRDANESEMPHSLYYYPKSGGIQSLVDAIATPHSNHILLNSPVERIEKEGDCWIINGTYKATHVLSTIPLDRLMGCFPEVPAEVLRASGRLNHNPLTTVLCRRSRPAYLSWLYLPSPEFLCHRIVYQGELSSGCCPPGAVSATYEATRSASAEEVLKGMPDRTTCPEAAYDEVLGQSYTEYAYPVYDIDSERNLGMVNSWLDGTGIRRCGRFAEWRYYNMDICIKRALETLNDLMSLVS